MSWQPPTESLTQKQPERGGGSAKENAGKAPLTRKIASIFTLSSAEQILKVT